MPSLDIRHAAIPTDADAHTHRHKTIAADSYWAVRASVARNPAAAALDDAFAKVSADNHVHDAVGVTANSGLTAQ